jgi:hypothetical protein
MVSRVSSSELDRSYVSEPCPRRGCLVHSGRWGARVSACPTSRRPGLLPSLAGRHRAGIRGAKRPRSAQQRWPLNSERSHSFRLLLRAVPEFLRSRVTPETVPERSGFDTCLGRLGHWTERFAIGSTPGARDPAGRDSGEPWRLGQDEWPPQWEGVPHYGGCIRGEVLPVLVSGV